MENKILLIVILIAYFIQLGYILYGNYKNRNKVPSNKEVLIEVFLILIGAVFSSFSLFKTYLIFFIWVFIAGFILDLWIRANIIIRIGKFYRKRFDNR